MAQSRPTGKARGPPPAPRGKLPPTCLLIGLLCNQPSPGSPSCTPLEWVVHHRSDWWKWSRGSHLFHFKSPHTHIHNATTKPSDSGAAPVSPDLMPNISQGGPPASLPTTPPPPPPTHLLQPPTTYHQVEIYSQES